ncbi:hypothetical protein N752_07095 [Desulforamulus aquiferis]|nr:hypothetical protein N752_07095 [Desulforamulus aquiferis]
MRRILIPLFVKFSLIAVLAFATLTFGEVWIGAGL